MAKVLSLPHIPDVKAALGALAGLVGLRTEEQPRYKVTLREGTTEVRRYQPFVAATTTAQGDYETTAKQSFHKLAAYVFGNNARSVHMPMTAPVLRAPEAAARGEDGAASVQSEATEGTAASEEMTTTHTGTWKMSFVLPSKFSLGTAPIPNDPSVRLSVEPAHTVAVLRYSGLTDEATIRAKTQELREWLGKHPGLKADPKGTPTSAQYDPPFAVPFLRRNEVHIPLV
jgi:hypothetical protein